MPDLSQSHSLEIRRSFGEAFLCAFSGSQPWRNKCLEKLESGASNIWHNNRKPAEAAIRFRWQCGADQMLRQKHVSIFRDAFPQVISTA